MNPDSAILSLIANLFTQITALQDEVAELRAELQPKDPNPPYDDV